MDNDLYGITDIEQDIWGTPLQADSQAAESRQPLAGTRAAADTTSPAANGLGRTQAPLGPAAHPQPAGAARSSPWQPVPRHAANASDATEGVRGEAARLESARASAFMSDQASARMPLPPMSPPPAANAPISTNATQPVSSQQPLGGTETPGRAKTRPKTAASAGSETLDQMTRVVAVVGDQPILAGDLLPRINEFLAPYADQLGRQELREQQERLMEKVLPQFVENKLVYMDFMRNFPADRFEDLQHRIYEEFNKSKLPEMLAQAKVDTAADLDAQLRENGSSLAKQQRLFFEQLVGQEMVRRNANVNAEITHDEMLSYYRTHATDYDLAAKARWERLMVPFDAFSSKGAAYMAIVAMGNEVLRGAPLEAVARRSSKGPRAAQGGQFDWTTQGSLVSGVIDQAVFELPVNRLSQIIEDQEGYHILRVLERQEATRIPFTDVQNEIADTIRKERFREEVQEYLTRLREETPIWSMFDDK